jgi:hypothetical protein
MKIFNLYADEWDETRDRAGWRMKEAFVGHHIGGALRGEPTLRTPEGEHVLKEGDVVAFPRGKDGAHQIVNRSDSPIRVLMLSSMTGPDIVEYIDTGKVSATSAEGEPITFARPGRPSSTGKARSKKARSRTSPAGPRSHC